MGKWQRALEKMVMNPEHDTLPCPAFWKGKRVLLTGHTGFKGAWLSLWLSRLGADVTGISLVPESTPNLFEEAQITRYLAHSHICDIREAATLKERVEAAQPEIILHLAAQSLVLTGYEQPLQTFDTNVMGTANLLQAARAASALRAILVVTTDKVYENHEQGYPFRETDRLGGRDPYSASKAASELVVACYRDSFLSEHGIAVAAARAGNVIGGGDWSANRLIPDAVRAWGNSDTLQVRQPEAVRPWQHVLEPLAAYLHLAQHIYEHPREAQNYNFGPAPQEAATVREVITLAQSVFGKGAVEWGEAMQGAYEAKWLALETAKARQTLGIAPRWGLEEGIRRTIEWYRRYLEGQNADRLCEADIAAFCNMGSTANG